MTLLKLLPMRLLFRRYSKVPSLKNEIIDWDYYSNPSNFVNITSNIISRKVYCDLKNVLGKLHELNEAKGDAIKEKTLKEELMPLLLWLPNATHPKVLENKSGEGIVIEKIGKKSSFTFYPSTFDNLTKRLNILRTRHLGHMTGNKSYYLKNDLATLEMSLVRFGISKLLNKGFLLMSVPDILSKDYIEKCGMRTENKHSQVYHIDSNHWAADLCLSGTAEMALASYFAGKTLHSSDLPLRICATSRCYRAEANKHQKEKGIFRVHQFTKVEMFGITSNDIGESEKLLEEFTSIQKELFSELGIHFQILDMPPCDLGLPAYHKIDMEAWIPTQKLFGEISSASNCTDYQSRRMDIKYLSSDGQTKFCHTVNGTACAIPRLLITIFENFQNLDGSINVPEPLHIYMKKPVISGKFKEVMLSTKPVG